MQGGDTNFYRYVGNNPVNRIDPTGMFSSELQAFLNETYARQEPQRIVNTVKPVVTTVAAASAAPFVAATVVNYTPIVATTIVTNPQQSSEFASGFVQGFVEEVFNETTGQPPSTSFEAAGLTTGRVCGGGF